MGIDSSKELEEVYESNFSLGFLGKDFSTKVALISLICHLTYKVRKKNPDITYYQVISKLSEGKLPDKYVVGLSIICKDFGYGCETFPTFDLEDKKIPNKIKEIMSTWTPF